MGANIDWAFPERMSNPCRACGIPLTYQGEVKSTDLILDYLRQILHTLNAQAQNPDFVCHGCEPRCASCSPLDYPDGGPEL